MFDKRETRGISRRQSRRVSARVRFEVSGRDENGHRFALQTETRNVCRDGGCIILDRDITPGNHIRLTSLHGMNFMARVHWCLYIPRNNVRLVGFKLTDHRQGWVVTDLSTFHRSPYLSPIQTATPELILAESTPPARTRTGKKAKSAKALKAQNQKGHLKKKQSFLWRLSAYFKIPQSFRAFRMVTIFRTE